MPGKRGTPGGIRGPVGNRPSVIWSQFLGGLVTDRSCLGGRRDMRRLVLLEPVRLLREGIGRVLGECGFAVIPQPDIDTAERNAADGRDAELVLTELPHPSCAMADWLARLQALYPAARIVILTNKSADSGKIEEALRCGAMGYVEKDMSSEAIRAILDAVMHGQLAFPRELRERMLSLAAQTRQTAAAEPKPAVAAAAAVNGYAPAPGHPPRSLEASAARTASVVTPLRPLARPPVAAPAPAAAAVRPAAAGGEADRTIDLSAREEEILSHIVAGHANKVIARELDISEATVKSHVKSLLRKLQFSNRTQAAIWAVGSGRQPAGGSANRPLPPF
ncbi:MAG: response regulator transcription factor [Alphaproteobacteria bacterium]